MHKDLTAPLLGPIIKNARERKGITPTQLAANIDASSTSVSRWEAGIQAPSLGVFFQLCHHLGLNAETVRKAVVTPRK